MNKKESPSPNSRRAVLTLSPKRKVLGIGLEEIKMPKHYFLIIFRSFKRFKSTFLINLIGLSTGLACVLFI